MQLNTMVHVVTWLGTSQWMDSCSLHIRIRNSMYVLFTEQKLWWDTRHSCFYYLLGRERLEIFLLIGFKDSKKFKNWNFGLGLWTLEFINGLRKTIWPLSITQNLKTQFSFFMLNGLRILFFTPLDFSLILSSCLLEWLKCIHTAFNL